MPRQESAGTGGQGQHELGGFPAFSDSSRGNLRLELRSHLRPHPSLVALLTGSPSQYPEMLVGSVIPSPQSPHTERCCTGDIIGAMRPFDPRLFAAILAAGSARLASRTLKTGGGSTVPGVVARRVDPRVLTKLSRRLPMGSAAITGTNGKTTTTRMVSRILRSAGIGAVNNSTGANLVTGVTAALVSDSGLTGTPASEIGLFEVDEASVPKVAAEAEIGILAVLNLFRDQLDRYGELAYTGKVIASAFGDLPPGGSVVLNADDPLVASLGRSAERPFFYGVDEPSLDTGRLQHVADSKDCPVCGTALVYETVYMGHVGVYDCHNCDFSRPEPGYRASRVRLQGAHGSEFLLSIPQGEMDVKISLPGLYNVYNALAAAAVAGEAGVGLADIL